MKEHVFYGEWVRFTGESKESACLAALAYLKDVGLIEIHDTNFATMNKYKRKFEAEHFWSSMLCERAESLEKQLSGRAPILTRVCSMLWL